jgi:hypothetical protein
VRPNTRVQRTRAARFARIGLPLTRHPLGRVGIAWVVAALAAVLSASPASVELSVTPLAAKPTVVVVEVRNPSDHAVSLDVIPSLELTSKPGAPAFWAPFRFAGPDHRLGANSRSPLSLSSRDVISVEIDLAALSWAEQGSSVWPSRGLREVVPAGTYSLVVTAGVEHGQQFKSAPARWVAP